MKPFTYLIGWTKLDVWYYGVRYGKLSDPVSLWTSYFTSSERVAKFRLVNGEPDVIQIRKVFQTPESAIKWEHRVLQKLKVTKSEKWLNATDNLAIKLDAIALAKISAKNKGRKLGKPSIQKGVPKLGNRGKIPWNKGVSTGPANLSEETIIKKSLHTKKMWEDGKFPNKNCWTEDANKKRSEALLGRVFSAEHKARLSQNKKDYYAKKREPFSYNT